MIESGNVYLPSKASWVQDFIDECAVFPGGQYDDSVDSLTQALNHFRRKGETIAFADYAEAAAVAGMLGKGGGGALLGSFMGPGRILAGLGLGGVAATQIFKDGGQGANYLPPEKLKAITGKDNSTSKFSSKWIPYQDSFDKASTATGLNRNLLYSVARAESGFKSNAVSKAGAIGVMQLMPKTAQGLGVDPTNPHENIMGGSKFLASMIKKYKGDVDMGLAAYNWGPGNLDKHLTKNQFKVDNMPEETKKYIRNVRYGEGEYSKIDPPTSANQQTTGGADSTLQALATILQTIANNTSQTADNTRNQPVPANPILANPPQPR